MSADDPCGTIQLELDSLRLCILGPKQEELRVRVDFELVSPEDISKGEKEPEETDATTLSRDHFSVLKWSVLIEMTSVGKLRASFWKRHWCRVGI